MMECEAHYYKIVECMQCEECLRIATDQLNDALAAMKQSETLDSEVDYDLAVDRLEDVRRNMGLADNLGGAR